MKIYVNNGRVVHVGDFILEYQIDNHPVEKGGPIIRYDLPPINCLPEGSEEIDGEIAWSKDGRVVLSSDQDAFFADPEMKSLFNY